MQVGILIFTDNPIVQMINKIISYLFKTNTIEFIFIVSSLISEEGKNNALFKSKTHIFIRKLKHFAMAASDLHNFIRPFILPF